MIRIPYLSVIRFSGADAGDFLHNQLSNDVLGLAEGASVFACYCEPKGRVLALMLVSRVVDAYCVVMASSLVKTVTDRLRMYVLRAKVEIEVLGQHALAGLESKTIANAEELATVIPIPGTDRSLLLMDTKTIDAGSDDAVNSWKAEELQEGIAWLCPATSGQFLPQWLGFDELGAVNFRKGCYPGQEIVARTKYLGKVKRRPRLLEIADAPCPASMDKIKLSSNDRSDEAVAVDCVQNGKTGALLFVVTRLEPESVVEYVEHKDQTFTVTKQ
jgi:folate-binding protein YgfZ